MKYKIHDIDGLTLITSHMSDTHTITAEIFVKAWAVYEDNRTNWLSHFLEHMFFKWSKKFDTAEKVSRYIESFGWEYNAYTWRELAWYYVKSASEYINNSLEILWDLMCSPIFDPTEIDKEHGVVIQEIKMYEDRPQSLVSQNWRNWYKWDTSHWWTILGPEKNVSSFTQQDLFNHKKSLYTKDNLILVIAWNITDEDKVLELAKKHFSDLPSTGKNKTVEYTTYLPKEKAKVLKKGISQNHLVMYADGFSREHWNFHTYCAKILSKILGWNTSSRLRQKIREEMGLCYYIWAGHGRSQKYGTFSINCWLDKKNFVQGVSEIYNQIWNIVEHGITSEEFDFAINNSLWSLQMGIETSSELSDWIWSDYILNKEINTIEDIVKIYKSITMKDIQNIISKLDKDNRYMYHIE